MGEINREIDHLNIRALERFIRKTIDPKYSLEWSRENEVVNVLYGKYKHKFLTVPVGGDSFLACCKDVIKRLE